MANAWLDAWMIEVSTFGALIGQASKTVTITTARS
jgi:hypothetical protein